jgi:hypothetical protein
MSVAYEIYEVLERQNETELKTVRTTLDSAIFRQFGICFGLCDIAG